MKRILLLFTLLLELGLIAQNSQQQVKSPIGNPIPALSFGTSRDFIPVSPNAGSLGIYGQIPVGNYTGVANIGIPLYEIQYKELSVPITINYHASGNKPDIFPSAVGLGWSLQAGGVITRVVRGYPDYEELKSNEGTSDPITTIDDPRAESNWSSNKVLDEYILHNGNMMNGITEPDEFQFNINGETGYFYANHDKTFRVQSAQGGSYLVEIHDNPINGTFKGLHGDKSGGTFRLFKSKELKSFTITDDKGIKYQFGKTFESIEFSRPALSTDDNPHRMDELVQPMSWFLTSIESPNGYKINFIYEQETFITKLRFSDYCRYGVTSKIEKNLTPFKAWTIDGVKNNMIHGCALKEIVFPAGKVLLENSLASSQLGYPKIEYSSGSPALKVGSNPMENFEDFEDYTDPNGNGDIVVMPTNIYPHKVDAIKIYSNANFGVPLSTISFVYTSSKTTRLKLNRLVIQGTSSLENNIYRFEYDAKHANYFPGQINTLPGYLTGETDHYGYYNGISLSSSFADERSDIPDYILKHPNYLTDIKEPSETLSQVEMLSKIIYPTGGCTSFEYEENKYGGKYSTWPFEVKLVDDYFTGGVRIKSIKNYDLDNKFLGEKKYHYVKNFISGGTKSSGVLVYTPTYVEFFEDKYMRRQGPDREFIEDKPLKYFLRFATSPIYPLIATRGNHITYSEVTVEETGNGFTTYKYKNYDNGYGDKELINYRTTELLNSSYENPVPFWKGEEGISMKLERGQLLSKEIYDKNKKIKKREIYAYNSNPNRFEENVRYLRKVANSVNILGSALGGVFPPAYRISAGLHYTYYPYLEKKTTTEFSDNGIIEKTEKFEYNTQYRLIKKIETSNSEGRKNMSTIAYPFDYVRDNVCSKLMAIRMLAYPLEKATFTDEILQQKHLYKYADNIGVAGSKSIMRPSQHSIQHGEKGPIQDNISFLKYDKVGNPISVSKLGSDTHYLWSYKGAHPIIIVSGIPYKEIESFFSSANVDFWLDQANPTNSDIYSLHSKLVNDYPKALVTAYTYKPLVGMTSVTAPSGLKTYYDYDDLGRLVEVYIYTDGKKILEKYSYNYAK